MMDDKDLQAIPVYSYDPLDRFYTGPEIAQPCPISGEPLLPAFTTLVAPPSDATDGTEIAVFDPAAETWEMRRNDYWRPKLKKRPVRLGHVLTGDLTILQIPAARAKYKGVPRVLSPAWIMFSLTGRIHYINALAHDVAVLNENRTSGFSTEELVHFKIACEDFVAQVKRLVDDIFVHEWTELERDSVAFKERRVVPLQGVNEISKLPGGTTKDRLLRMSNEDPLFFQTLIDLRNSFSHHLAVPETYMLMGTDHPTVNTLYTRNGDLNELELIEVYLEDLSKSLNAFLQRTFQF